MSALQCGFVCLQGSQTSDDVPSSRSSRSGRRGRDYAAAKALSFDASRSQSDDADDDNSKGVGVNGPTTRRQWSEWVGKSPPPSTGKENQVEVRHTSSLY